MLELVPLTVSVEGVAPLFVTKLPPTPPKNDQGKGTTIIDTIEKAALVFGLSVDEIEWAIEEYGECETEGLWPGQTVVITLVD